MKDCELKLPFSDLKIDGTTTLAILYHNKSFTEVDSIVSNKKEFFFDQRYVLVAPITEWIKLVDRNENCLPKIDFKAL